MNRQKRIAAFDAWLAALPIVKANKGPARGTIAGALVVLERLKKSFALRLNDHLAPKGAQIKGAGGMAIKALLAEFGETRPFVKEGGRTNRGLRDSIEKLLAVIGQMQLAQLPATARTAELHELQQKLLDYIRAFHNRQRLKVSFNPAKTTQQHVADLLAAARIANKEGPVAQYLIGAKLQLRYPALAIENNSATTADSQLGRAGDFLVGDTAFHVTVAPMPAVFDKCRANLDAGLHACLLVPARLSEAARQLAGETLAARVSLFAIESFVSQNVDEIGQFRSAARASDFGCLLAIYNQRVDAMETDKSLLIEVPRNLIIPT